MKHIYPHLNLNFTRAELRLKSFIEAKFPYHKDARPNVDELRSLEAQKENINIDFEGLQMQKPDAILKDYEAIKTILEKGRVLVQQYYSRLQKDKRQLLRDLKFSNNSPECLEFQRNWLPYRQYWVIFRPNYPKFIEDLKLQDDFSKELISKDFTKCTSDFPSEMKYFIDLTRVVNGCIRLSKEVEADDFAAINENADGVNMDEFFE